MRLSALAASEESQWTHSATRYLVESSVSLDSVSIVRTQSLGAMMPTTTNDREEEPTIEELEEWSFSGIAEATDGCKVEPDGICEHGCESWLLKLGLI